MATNITAMSAATVANNRMRFFMHYLLTLGGRGHVGRLRRREGPL